MPTVVKVNVIIPDIQGAVKFQGGGAARISLDTDEQDLPEVMKLVAFGGNKVIRATFEIPD